MDEPQTVPSDDEPSPPEGHPEKVLELLSEGVPVSLLLDLTAPSGPDSESILDEEGEPEEAWWEQP